MPFLIWRALQIRRQEKESFLSQVIILPALRGAWGGSQRALCSLLRERRKQGLASWIECPWGVGREAGLVQIKLMLLMDLVLVEMGTALWQPQNRRGRGFLEVELARQRLCCRGPSISFS